MAPIGGYSPAVRAQIASGDTVTLTVGTGRPVANAVEELVSRYGYPITYEDPQLSYDGDWRDVTNEVLRDLDKYPPGAAPKVLVPQGANLILTLPASHSIDAGAMATVLNDVLKHQTETRLGGRFRVQRDGNIFHVIPSEARDRNGNWIPQTPVLDALISFPTRNRDRMQTLQAFTKALRVATGVDVNIVLMGGLDSPDHPRQYRLGAANERARDVLTQALTLIGKPPTEITWLMFCDKQACAVRLESVPSSHGN